MSRKIGWWIHFEDVPHMVWNEHALHLWEHHVTGEQVFVAEEDGHYKVLLSNVFSNGMTHRQEHDRADTVDEAIEKAKAFLKEHPKGQWWAADG